MGTPENFVLAIHGGAGAIKVELSSPDADEERSVLRFALESGQKILASGGSALDAVVAAVQVMEDSPRFNAGRGSVFTHEGNIEMDASIMEGTSRKAGGVAGVTRVRNPILAARAVMEHSPHVLLSGKGADEFCAQLGLCLEDSDYFRTEARLRQLQAAKKEGSVLLDHGGGENSGGHGGAEGGGKYGTVGAVAKDIHGHLAAATSTGGMTNKQWGRVGDSPIIGAGTWADDNSVAVSCTGVGEAFIRSAAAHEVHARIIHAKQPLSDAVRSVVFEEISSNGGEGGIIAVDSHGNLELQFSTPGMFRGSVRGLQPPHVAIWKNE